DGHAVTCLDNYYTGSPDNVADLLDHPRFELLQHDIVEALPSGLSPTHIFNLACPASPVHYQRDPIQTLRTCVFGSYHLLELAKHCNARILQASTSEVYGKPRSEEHTSELQSRENLVCRLLLEKKKQQPAPIT